MIMSIYLITMGIVLSIYVYCMGNEAGSNCPSIAFVHIKEAAAHSLSQETYLLLGKTTIPLGLGDFNTSNEPTANILRRASGS